MSQKSSRVPEAVVNKKTMELIESGLLLKERGLDELYRQISELFPDNKFDKRRFKSRVFNLIFVVKKEIDNTLQGIVRNVAKIRIDDAKLKRIVGSLQSVYPFIPEEFIIKRAKWHRGLISGRGKKLMGKNLPGIGRIDLSGGTPDFEIPKARFDEPFCLRIGSSVKPVSVMILNGANLGIKHGADIVGNIARKALSDAEERRDKAVILTNFLCFDLKRAGGPAKTARAQVLGDNINPELIQDSSYRKIVENIIATKPMNQIAYRTPEELVNDVLGGWTKICTKPNNRPEYNGPIYVIIGLNELALIFAVTYWEIRWWTHKKQTELRADKGIAKKALKEARQRLREAEKDEDGKEISFAHKEVVSAHERLESIQHQLARTTITDVASQESQRFFNYAYGVVVQKIEEAIPNAKVIGEGTSHIDVGGKKIEIHVPAHLRVTDALLSDYALSYGPKTLREQIADAAVICHPWALQYRSTGREIDHDGKRDSIKVHVAPIAVDDHYLRSELPSLRAKDHPILKAVFNETFKPGILRLWCSRDMIEADEIPVDALESFKRYRKFRIQKRQIEGSMTYRRGPKYLWLMCCSDQHWGGRSKEFVWDANKGIRLSMAEAVFEMMRRESLCENGTMPVHFLCSPDDPTQGQNHKYRTEPHPHQISYRLIEKITGNLLRQARDAKTRGEILEMAEKIRNLALHQFEKRGSDFLFEQMIQMMERHIGPNLDMFSAILRRARNAKVIISGVGEFVVPEYGGFDTRNVGLINIGTGDRHFAKTVDFEMMEGPLYAQRLRDLLCGMDEWKERKDFIEKMVVSPIYGQTCIGWGVISVEGKHQYGLEIRSAPTNMAGWGDTLRGHVKRDLQRGNYSRIWNGKLPVIKIFGDKHFFGGVSTSFAIYHMSPAAVHTDAYGEHGFPPNNTGVSFLGMPVDGPDSGPILWRTLPFDIIKDFMENPRSFDWDEFLPCPA